MVAVKWITFPPTSLTWVCDLNFWVSNKKNLLTGLSPKIISLSTKQFTKVQIWEKIPHKICIVMIRRRLLEEECYHHLISLRWDILLISSFSRSFVSWVSFFSSLTFCSGATTTQTPPILPWKVTYIDTWAFTFFHFLSLCFIWAEYHSVRLYIVFVLNCNISWRQWVLNKVGRNDRQWIHILRTECRKNYCSNWDNFSYLGHICKRD